MPVIPVVKSSFAGGEWDPALAARVDLAKYPTANRKLYNMFVHATGGASNRPGTEYRATAFGQGILIPFQYSVIQAYMLEFTNAKMRIFKDGDLVVFPIGHPDEGDVVEVATPFLLADLPYVKFTQSADVMYLSHPDYKTQKLVRNDHHDWTISDAPTATTLAGPTGVSTAASTAGSGRTYYYRVSVVKDGEESLPSAQATQAFAKTWAAGEFITVSWSAVTGAEKYRVFASKRGQWGLIGEVDGAATSFVDDNINPAVNETYIGDPIYDFSVVGGRPGAVGIFEQRLWLARSDEGPQTVWSSRTGIFSSFATRLRTIDSDPVEATMASTQVNEILHIVPLDRLVILTTGGEWILDAGANADGITPTQLRFRINGYRGCNDVRPITINNNVLFVGRSGNTVQDLSYKFENDAYTGDDLSLLARHLLEDRRIVSWCYQQNPYGVIWAVRDDGKLLAFTYLPNQDVTAWSVCETEGSFEWCASIPRPDGYDEVYFIVKRTVGEASYRYVERLAERVPSDYYFVDSGRTYDGGNGGTTTMTLTSSNGWTAGKLITITASASTWTNSQGASGTTFVPTNVGDAIAFQQADGSWITCRIEEYTSSTVVTARPDRDIPVALQATPTLLWHKAVDTISGLDHLNGHTVAVVADGDVIENKVVAAGSVSLARPYRRIHVGLPYAAEAKTMSLEAEGTQGKERCFRKVTLRVKESRGALVGPEGGELVEVKWRSDEDYNEPTKLITGDVSVVVDSKWTTDGSITVRQEQPMPLTVLAIFADMELGGA